MSEIYVAKFGGSSTAKPEHLSLLNRIIRDDPRRKIVVLSAPGKRYENDVKITDLLIDLAENRTSSSLEAVIDRFQSLYHGCAAEMRALLQERLATKGSPAAVLDAVKSAGEEANARFFANNYGFDYVNNKDLFKVSSDFGKAKILPESEEMIRSRLRDVQKTAIIAGFYGYTSEGLIATLGRNESDTTGAYLAFALNASLYEIFSDREGVLAANAFVKQPVMIPELTFREMRDLAYSGFGIVHPRVLEYVAARRVPVHVRETFSFPKEGTYIVADRISDLTRPVVGVAYQEGFCSFDIDFLGLNDRVGILADICGIFKKRNISLEFSVGAIDDVSLIFKANQLSRDNSPSGILKDLYDLLGEQARVDFQEHLGCLVVAGKGLRGRRGIAAEIQLTLAQAGVNIKFISQGSNERCIAYGIEQADAEKAVRAVYERYLV